MTVSLPKQFESWANAEVSAGRAASVEGEVVRTAVEEHQRRVEAFRASLDGAVAEADAIGWIDGDEVLAEMDALIDTLEQEAAQERRG